MQNARLNFYNAKVPRPTTLFGEVARCSVAASALKPTKTIHISPPPPFAFHIISINTSKDNPALISVHINFNLSENCIFIIMCMKKGGRL